MDNCFSAAPSGKTRTLCAANSAPPFPLLYLVSPAGETKMGVSSCVLIDIFSNKVKLLFVSSRSPKLTSCNARECILFIRIFTWHYKLSNFKLY